MSSDNSRTRRTRRTRVAADTYSNDDNSFFNSGSSGDNEFDDINDSTDTDIPTYDNPTNHSPVFESEEDGSSVTRLATPANRLTAEDNIRDAMDDPVVGWLVIINGAGKGIAYTLGYGINNIGREEKNKVSLDNGDEKVSREVHAVLTYDKINQDFYIQHGDGRNLTYIEDPDGNKHPVLVPRVIRTRENIIIGDTKLKFIAFCADGFDWEIASD